MDITHELSALHRNLLSTPGRQYFVSRKQIGSLVCLMMQGLPDRKDRDLRIAVLRAWIADSMKQLFDVEVESTKNISGPIASFLIDLLREPNNPEMVLNDYGHELIEETAKFVQTTRAAPKTPTQSEASSKVPARVRA